MLDLRHEASSASVMPNTASPYDLTASGLGETTRQCEIRRAGRREARHDEAQWRARRMIVYIDLQRIENNHSGRLFEGTNKKETYVN